MVDVGVVHQRHVRNII